MISYEQVKKWLKDKENRDKIAFAASFVLIFFVGFGAGRYERAIRRQNFPMQNNYTTSAAKKPLQTTEAAGGGEGMKTSVATSTAATSCIVKGNISTSGKKVYHVAGGAFYKIVKPEQCFNTEKEAEAAGFTKSQR